MYKTIFVPVDNSDHSMASIDLAIELAKRFDADLVGSHAYAARMHDYRFKQMEFTLPEEYLVEEEMEKQRKVHDTLITMGLELISDSYLTVMDKRCREEKLPFQPKMYDGKNWKIIVQDIEESELRSGRDGSARPRRRSRQRAWAACVRGSCGGRAPTRLSSRTRIRLIIR